MNTNNLVSIITPAYNCSMVVGETIKSVLDQTYEDWEMIIVDDASTDDTLEIVNSYASKDKRIKVFAMKQNRGSASAKNFAIDKAKGRYIAFLDADDLWMRDKLKKQIFFMEKNNFPFTFTAYEFMKEKSKYRYSFNVPKSINYKKYLGNTIIGNSTVIIDRFVIGDVHIEEGFLEDVLTWMFILKQGYVAHGLNENLMAYRVYSNSKSGKKIKNAHRYFKCLIETQNINVFCALFYQISYLLHALKKRIFTKKRIAKDSTLTN